MFSEVANELGVQEAFCELIPEELWNQRVQMMSVPDWMLLLCKLESTISDNSWQMILNQTRLGKSGVSYPLTIFCVKMLLLLLFSLSSLDYQVIPLTINELWSIPFKYPLPFPTTMDKIFWCGGRWGALKVISEGIDWHL